MVDIHVTVTGPVTIVQADTTAILDRIDALEAAVTTPLTTFDDALNALTAQVAQLTADEASERAAFDALAAAVRAFIASVQSAGNLSADQATQAQALLDSIAAADAGETSQAADEATLQGEVPQG